MIKTLIMPLVTNGPDIVFQQNGVSYMMTCICAINSVDISKFDEIYFVINHEVDRCLYIKERIDIEMRQLSSSYHFIELHKMTSSPAETIYHALQLLKQISSEGRSIFIKDGDNSFYIDYNGSLCDDIVVASSLEKQTLVDPIHKSYMMTDKQGFITNCIERRVISDKFIAGGYGFADANDFIIAYDNISESLFESDDKHIYISDIIYWLMMNKDKRFMPVNAITFNDYNI